MCGSFNNYARKVRNPNLPIGVRISALHSCIHQYGGSVNNLSHRESHKAIVEHLSHLAGFNLRTADEERPLLDALQRMELVRNQVLELRRAFDRKRIRLKMRGRRVPSKAERQALAEAIEAVKRAAGMPIP